MTYGFQAEGDFSSLGRGRFDHGRHPLERLPCGRPDAVHSAQMETSRAGTLVSSDQFTVQSVTVRP